MKYQNTNQNHTNQVSTKIMSIINFRLVIVLAICASSSAKVANGANVIESTVTIAHHQLDDRDEQLLSSQRFAGSLWLTESEPNLTGNEKLLNYIKRIGPNIRASTDYHDYKDIQLNETLLAWKLMREQVEKFAQDEVHMFRPKIKKLLLSANVSRSCFKSVDFTLDSLEKLDSWSVQCKLVE